MKNYLLLSVFFIVNLWAAPLNDDVVDEAKTVAIHGSESSSSNPARNVIFSNGKVNIYKDKVSLASIKKELIITITDAFHLPNTLIIKRGDKVVQTIKSKVAKDIGFAIDKGKLKVGDKIVITTSESVKIVDMRVTQ